MFYWFSARAMHFFFPSVNLTVSTHKSSILLLDAFMHQSLFLSYCQTQNFMLVTLLKLFLAVNVNTYRLESTRFKTNSRESEKHRKEVNKGTVCKPVYAFCIWGLAKEKPVCTRKGEKLCDLEGKLINSALKLSSMPVEAGPKFL